MDQEKIIQRIDKLLGETIPVSEGMFEKTSALVICTRSILEAVYGTQSSEVNNFNADIKKIADYFQRPTNASSLNDQIKKARSYLTTTREALVNGYINIGAQIAGGVIVDFLTIARELLQDPSDNAKNVSSVLVAAVFEDTIRRLGRELGGITEKMKLDLLIGELSSKGIISRPTPSILVGYLPYRNDALHADWGKIDRSTITSVMSTVEGLIEKYF